MNGLLDFDDPKTLGLLSMGLGLLGSRGRFGEALGQAGLQGINAMQQASQRRADKQFRDAQLEAFKSQADERKLSLEERRRKAEEEARKRDALGRMLTPGEPMIQAPELGGLPMFSQPQTVTPAAPVRLDPAQMLRMGFSPEEVNQTIAAMNAGRTKVKQTIETEEGGRPVTRMIDEYGQPVGGTMPKYVAPVQVDTGAGIQFVRPEAGSQFTKSMSPAERDAAARGWASNRIAQQRLALDQGVATADAGGPNQMALTRQFGKAPSGYRWTPAGGLEVIPGGPATKAENATEGERKAATLLRRMEGSLQQLNTALGENPRAASPEYLPSTIRSLPMVGGSSGANATANLATSQERQRVEAAQLDILDAALTLGTGAAYTREQLEGYRKSYFPQMFDSPKTIADKQARLRNVLEAARLAAGRATGGANAPADATPNNDPLGLR